MATPPTTWSIVVNPTKFDDLSELRSQVAGLCAREAWPEPTWVETTKDDPGHGQARQAVEDGAELVCSLGGDGTVRTVAEALAGTDTPLGILPGGTGNLLARNLGLPVDSLEAAIATALTGSERRIDVGEVRFDGGDAHTFLVMCGIGADAETMANADERLKGIVGWPAYLVSGLGTLFGRGFGVRVRAGAQRAISQHARSVLIGNCGQLQGGLELMPEARVDDGLLDTLLVSPQGLWGWGPVFLDVITRHRRGHRRLRAFSSDTVRVKASRPVEAQVDGDAVGPRRRMEAELRPGALLVRVPGD